MPATRAAKTPCLNCGQPIRKMNRSTQRYCSLQCADSHSSESKCIDCGDAISNKGNGRPKLRCRKCKVRRQRKSESVRLKSNHRKRCRLYGVRWDSKVTAAKVFERDGFKCHLCKRKTLLTFVFVDGRPDPRSPTIDHHPYPLSAGVLGHEWDNVRCACWGCNTKKSAQWSRQPLLFR